MAKRESKFEQDFNKKLKDRLPGCHIEKGNSAMVQGTPDRTIFYGDRWAKYEVKKEKPSAGDFQPNQEYYLEKFNNMSFAICVYPENEEEALDAISSALEAPRRKTRVSRT